MPRPFKILIAILALLLTATTLYWYSSSHVTKNIDNYIYNLPYAKGSTHRIVQGYGGLFSHKNAAAIDFAMPVGTAIHAARGGIIYRYKDDSKEGGIGSKYNRKANYVIIKHDDGSFGSYLHLMYKGVVKKTGKIRTGELLGYSGATGYALQPHLHFSVKSELNYKVNSYRKTYFRTAAGNIFLKTGTAYANQ
jgi:murein DD-endopeptidase MepM/ murein hydrolase activator NlpD